MSKYPLWNGTIAVERMDDSHLANALRRSQEIIVDIDAEIEDLEEWQTDKAETLDDRLREWQRWEEILTEEQQTRETLIEEGERY